jgi:hypothetical protein
MRSFALPFLLLLLAGFVTAQSSNKGQAFPRSLKPMARFSFRSTGAIASGNTNPMRNICFSLDPDGTYLIARTTKWAGREVYQGKLTAEDMSRFTDMLKQVDFTNKPLGAGPVLRGSESFVAEVTRNEKTIHANWFDPDEREPFPAAVTRIIDWLQNFNVENAARLKDSELSTSAICPGWGEPLQPNSAAFECPNEATPSVPAVNSPKAWF